MIVTTVFVVFFYVVAFLKLCNVDIFRENATLLTCSLASVYMVYMSWTTIASTPYDECKPHNPVANSALQIFIGLIFTFLTILSIAIAT